MTEHGAEQFPEDRYADLSPEESAIVSAARSTDKVPTDPREHEELLRRVLNGLRAYPADRPAQDVQALQPPVLPGPRQPID